VKLANESAGTTQDFLHERRLALGVGLPVLAVADGQVVLKAGIASTRIGVFTQVVPEQQLIAVAGGADGDQVQVVGAPGGVRLAEPEHFTGAVGGVQVAERDQQVDARARGGQIADAGQDVDDRLGVQPRNSGTAHMVDAAADELAEHRPQQAPLVLEPGWPDRVIRLDGHRLVALSQRSSLSISRHLATLPAIRLPSRNAHAAAMGD
jgi:hypothetical protein